jgi:hypothetical protein
VKELYGNLFSDLYTAGKIIGVKQTLVNAVETFEEYRTQYQSAETPYVDRLH